MTVVLWMNKCPFCGEGHYTDQDCDGGDNEKLNISKEQDGLY